MKKITSLLIIAVLILSIFSACGNSKDTSESQTTAAATTEVVTTAAPTETQAEPVTLTMMVQNHPAFPFKEDWPIWKWHEKNANVTLKVSAYTGNWWDAIPLVVASGDMPDLMWMVNGDAMKYGQQGALVNYLEKLDQMPAFKAFMDQYPSQVQPLLASDGKLYLHPSEGIFGKYSGRMWLYREDIFKKNNIALPNNYDEFYQVLLKLKQLYPESTPLYFPGNNSFNPFGLSFGCDSVFFYDPETKTTKYGPMEEGMKQLTEFIAKAYKDKLIPAEYGNVSFEKRDQLVTTDKTFIFVTWGTDLDTFNSTMRKTNPDFKLAFMPPPAAPNGKRLNDREAFLGEGLTVTSTSKNMEAALKYVDYLLTDKARDTMSWGEEGTTYQVVDGKKQFLPVVKDELSAGNTFGMFTSTNMAYVDFDAKLALMSEEMKTAYNEGLNYVAQMSTLPPLTADESNAISLESQAIDKYMNENISKMIIGEIPMSDWDKYVEGLKKLGVENVLKVFSDAEARRQQSLNK